MSISLPVWSRLQVSSTTTGRVKRCFMVNWSPERVYWIDQCVGFISLISSASIVKKKGAEDVQRRLGQTVFTAGDQETDRSESPAQ